MDFYESDLEDIIWKCLQTEVGCKKLDDKGLDVCLPNLVYRQLRLGNYGILDLLTVSKSYEDGVPVLHVVVYELKKDSLNYDALKQLIRYITGLKHYLSKRGVTIEYHISGRLIGKSLDKGDWIYIMDCMDIVEVYTYEYTIDGIEFDYETFGYKLTNPNFKL